MIYANQDEWSTLSEPAKMAVEHDFSHAPYDLQLAYWRNIGDGNLKAYADCLLIEAVKVWVKS